MRRENNKIVEEGIKKIEEGNVVKKDSLLSLTILIDFFQIAVYLTLFVLNGISCLILLLAIISRVFNQLILVKLLIVCVFTVISQGAPLGLAVEMN